MSVHVGGDSPAESGVIAAIRLLCRDLEDIEALRIALTSRRKASERLGIIVTGDGPLAAVRDAEKETRRDLVETWETLPLAHSALVRETNGLRSGVLVARLVGETGDPAIAEPMKMAKKKQGDTTIVFAVPDGDPYPRSLRQLWQYCGVGDPVKPQRGCSEEDARRGGNRRARVRLWNISDQLVRQGALHGRTGQWWDLYEQEKAAATQTEKSARHAYNRAMRRVGKEFLRALWNEARSVQPPSDGHERRGGAGFVAGGVLIERIADRLLLEHRATLKAL